MSEGADLTVKRHPAPWIIVCLQNLKTKMLLELTYLFLAGASSQDTTPGCITYTPCIEQNDIYVSSTCQPMTNATMSAICMCYANANRNLCFLQCPNDPVVQNAAAAFQSTLVASCSAVNLNPKALPPAPWVTFTSSRSPVSATGITASPTASSTSVIPAKNTGNPVGNIGIAIVAVVAMFFAI